MSKILLKISEFRVIAPLPPCGIYFARIDCHALWKQLLWYWCSHMPSLDRSCQYFIHFNTEGIVSAWFASKQYVFKGLKQIILKSVVFRYTLQHHCFLCMTLSCIELIILEGRFSTKESPPEILSLNGSIMQNYLKCNAKKRAFYPYLECVSIRVTLGN